ncbi:MAG: YdcF family protein [archaeon GBS-70-058]|nr:YdcF family protein [Candidatus Culexarchaeum nevadense]
MEKYDLVIVLGSQVKKRDNRYFLAPHTELKARAAGIAYKRGIVKKFIISGGYNFGVRYDYSSILEKPNFSFEAFALARWEKSEAQIIAEFLHEEYKVPLQDMLLEELSATTEENVEFLKTLLKRQTFNFAKRIGVLTILSHMERALPLFKRANLDVKPLFAEELLILEKYGVDKICEFYSIPSDKEEEKIKKIEELISKCKEVSRQFYLT